MLWKFQNFSKKIVKKILNSRISVHPVIAYLSNFFNSSTKGITYKYFTTLIKTMDKADLNCYALDNL